MREEHEYKRRQDFISEDVSGYSDKEDSYDEYKKHRDYHTKKRKHKRHKYEVEEYYSNEKMKSQENSRHSNKIIHVHGSSSEEDSEVEQKIISRGGIQKQSDYSKNFNTKKEGRNPMKKQRSRVESLHDSERQRHQSCKKEQFCRKKLRCSDSDEYYTNHKKIKSREVIPENYKELKDEEKKIKEKKGVHERKKVKTEYNEPLVPLRTEMDRRKNIKMESQRDKNNKCKRSQPSGSRNDSRFEGEIGRDREIHEWGGSSDKVKQNKSAKEVQKPNFELSGKLAEDTNTFNGVVIKYSEPPEARMPKKRWRLYPFKGDQGLPTLYIHRQSAYLLGRDRKVVDIPIDHPSCSKQHAALQYRLVSYQRPNGTLGKQIRLYIIDLESANGTFINNNKIEAKKYVELFEKDVIKFGFSSREYVLLHEHSKDDDSEEDS